MPREWARPRVWQSGQGEGARPAAASWREERGPARPRCHGEPAATSLRGALKEVVVLRPETARTQNRNARQKVAGRRFFLILGLALPLGTVRLYDGHTIVQQSTPWRGAGGWGGAAAGDTDVRALKFEPQPPATPRKADLTSFHTADCRNGTYTQHSRHCYTCKCYMHSPRCFSTPHSRPGRE